jgi:hypothetical protein
VIFRAELAEKVMAGEKTVTRRLCSSNPRSPWWREVCALQVGRDYAVQPKRGVPAIGRVRVVSVRRESLLGIGGLFVTAADEEARREGFDSYSAFKEAWIEINGGWNVLAEVWRVEFEVIQTGWAV